MYSIPYLRYLHFNKEIGICMGKPAARMGDTTAHGGSIVVGAPTVFIGGAPAARVGDQHLCPMLNPGTPPPPHIGGPITLGSTGVFICGMPAARVGDMATCSGPPDTIAMGCPTVFIGEVGSPGGAGSPAAGGRAASAKSSPGDAPPDREDPSEPEETHFLDIAFTDQGGFPITGPSYTVKGPDGKEVKGALSGRIQLNDTAEGEHEISLRLLFDAHWQGSAANAEDTVKISASALGFDEGSVAEIRVFQKNYNFADSVIASFATKISGEKISADWALEVGEKLFDLNEKTIKGGGFPSSFFYFQVSTLDCSARSGLLRLNDWIEIELTAEQEMSLKGRSFQIRMPNGEVRRGSLDGAGKARIEGIQPGQVEFSLIPSQDS